MAVNEKLKVCVENYINEHADIWKYSNSILYRMCEEQPLHDDLDIIASKLLVIGRTYAAAIERRKTNDGYDNDSFYYEIVAPTIMKNGKELDERLENIRQFDKPTYTNIDDILDTHKFLTDIFNHLTALDKRSLASKYLHFHAPHMFFIYDSRADSNIRKMASKSIYQKDGDPIYTDFAMRCLMIQTYVEKKYDKLLSPRDIDNLLLFY